MRLACFVTGAVLAMAGFLLIFIYPDGSAWLLCIVMAVVSVVAGGLLPQSTSHTIHVETEPFKRSVPLTDTSQGQQTSLIPHPDMFSEGRVHQDLRSLVTKPGPIRQHFELQRQRRQREKEIQLVNQYGEFFSAASQTIKAKNEMLRARNEYLGLERENQQKNVETEAAIAKSLAEAAEQRKRLEELTAPRPPEIKPEPKFTPDQQRRLKRMEIEDKLRELDRMEEEALKNGRGDLDRMRAQNMYADKREELREQLARHLI
jgi:hypothetical protein